MIASGRLAALAAAALLSASLSASSAPQAAPPRSVTSAEQFAGHRIGADNTLVRWDKIVEYMKLVAQSSDRVRVRELGTSTAGNPFIALEISAPETLRNLDHFKALEPQTYPEVRRAPNAPPEPPYDVSAWSLGMLLGVDHVVVKKTLAPDVALETLRAAPMPAGRVTGSGSRFSFDCGDLRFRWCPSAW